MFSRSVNTRGIRNNNPFNIKRSSNKWLGKLVPFNDKTFEQFSSMEYGVRAGVLLLRNYIRKNNVVYGRCNTIAKIVPRWAPSSENDTIAYIKYLESALNIDRHKLIVYPSKDFVRLCCAIMYYESLFECPDEYIYTIIQQFKLY